MNAESFISLYTLPWVRDFLDAAILTVPMFACGRQCRIWLCQLALCS